VTEITIYYDGSSGPHNEMQNYLVICNLYPSLRTLMLYSRLLDV